MAELAPVPLHALLRRAHYEYERRRAIFDLPERKFRRSSGAAGPTLDLSVPHAGGLAANPIGPAAGPHTQLAQNIVLGWLAGARVFELKTIQANDRLSLSKPCIDMATVGYNTEWSQELRLEASLREYVKAAMIIEIFGASGIHEGAGDRGSGFGPSTDSGPSRAGSRRGTRDWADPLHDAFSFDISVGYDLAGIRSAAVVSWLGAMRHAGPIIDELRREIPDEYAAFRDFPFRTSLASGITLSTFHGTPAGEIERIGEFLIGDMGFHTVIKLNPPMLGRARVEEILHGALGYTDVVVNPDVYERDLPFAEAVDILRRLQSLARRRGLTAGVKCGNTLEVLNSGSFLKERVKYLSGQPLHALHAALALQWREAFGASLPISFAAGVDAQNAADCVAAGLVPVTTCTDLLRAGGFSRLPRYFTVLEERMRAAGARSIPEFILRSAEPAAEGGPGQVGLERAMLANARALLQQALSAERYGAARNRRPPRKLGTHLWLWDCLSCTKCIPACPNDAVFEIEIEPFIGEVPDIAVDGDGWREVDRRLYRALKPTQIAIFADACNDCGNCDVFCPEDGGPQLEKPRFFGSIASWLRAAPLTGFVLTREHDAFVLRGRMADDEYALTYVPGSSEAVFETSAAAVTLNWHSHAVVSARRRVAPSAPASMPVPSSARVPNPESRGPATIALSPAMTLRLLLDGVLKAPRVHFVNAPFVE